MCEGCSPSCAFSYVGGLVVNASFVFLISWGTAVFWPIGLAAAILYTAGLFVAASCLRQRDANVTSINLLYLVAVVGVGASGMILAYNVVGCDAVRPPGGGSSQAWMFPADDVTSTTAEVLSWADDPQWKFLSDASFVTVRGSTFFRGANGSSTTERLWRVGGDDAVPSLVATTPTTPRQLTAIGSALCLSGWDVFVRSSRIFCCSDAAACAASLAAVEPVDGGAEIRNPTSLLVSGGALWFKAEAPFGFSPDTGVIYRSTPPFATATLLSRPVSTSFPAPPPPVAPGDSPASFECDSAAGFRAMALASLALATLPALITTFALWWRIRAATMAFAAFAGISAMALNIYAIVEPSGESAFDVIRWWFAAFGFVWAALFAAIKLAERANEATVSWGVNAACIAYFAAVHSLTEVPFTGFALNWVLYNLTCPLLLLVLAIVVSGVAAGLPLVLASAGLVMDTWKVADQIVSLISDATLQLFVRFVVLAVVGVGIVALGILYSRFQEPISEWVDTFAARACVTCRPRRAATTDEQPADSKPAATQGI